MSRPDKDRDRGACIGPPHSYHKSQVHICVITGDVGEEDRKKISVTVQCYNAALVEVLALVPGKHFVSKSDILLSCISSQVDSREAGSLTAGMTSSSKLMCDDGLLIGHVSAISKIRMSRATTRNL